MTRSSITLSLTGGEVDWMRNTSFPRTFSEMETRVSPSENLETSASVMRTRSARAISLASLCTTEESRDREHLPGWMEANSQRGAER